MRNYPYNIKLPKKERKRKDSAILYHPRVFFFCFFFFFFFFLLVFRYSVYHSGTNKDNAVRFYATDFLYNSKWCIWPKRFTAGRQKQINSTSFATFFFSNFSTKSLTSYENRIFHALQKIGIVSCAKQIFFVYRPLDLEFPTCES